MSRYLVRVVTFALGAVDLLIVSFVLSCLHDAINLHVALAYF